jgi:DNA polymerase-1
MNIHKSTASKVFNVPLEEVTNNVVMPKLSILELYMGFRLLDFSNQTNLSRSESAALIEAITNRTLN